MKDKLPRHGRLLLAVSGGIDSVCMLHACVELSRLRDLTLEVAHVDHRLRETSGRDAAFVRELAGEHRLPFHLHMATAKPAGVNTEAWARRLRYRFFRELLAERSLEWVLTAHNANDVAETLLMRLVANKELRSIQECDRRRRCLRPLLTVERSTIAGYVEQYNLRFVDDETNSDTALLRNKVRHNLLPFLAHEFDPRMVEVLARRAAALASDSAALEGLVASEVERLQQMTFGSREWFRKVRLLLAEHPPALQYRLLEQIFRCRLGFALGRQQCELLAGLFRGQANAVELPGGLGVRRKGGGILICGVKSG